MSEIITFKNDRSDLVKHVFAIHCTNNLTLVQRKLFNALLYFAYYDLPVASMYSVRLADLCNLIGYKSNDYKLLKKSLIGLMSTVVEWDVIDQSKASDDIKWTASTILASVDVRNGVCTYEYSSVMREELYEPEIYGKLDMSAIGQFSSTYGISLYENCVRYQRIKQTPWLSLDVFRKIMGVKKGQYKQFRDFKRRVIEVGIKEVNKYSNLNVNVHMKKEGLRVVGLKFEIDNKLKKETTLQKTAADETRNSEQRLVRARIENRVKNKPLSVGQLLTNTIKPTKTQRTEVEFSEKEIEDFLEGLKESNKLVYDRFYVNGGGLNSPIIQSLIRNYLKLK
ncbi:replication initiation protein [Piscirickettsia litoralis]|uniref:Initiator Rep protein WH1 domain-containing protein n=1 Tax=Piscirickettsia litoralis TaxID=1891921 RepID=A0ABX2ZYN1_9GAMM|nr:replication initiation protein [Piscirickettsia litoralis]ODN41623.1 hypothetical protein BGC07_16145 [Piscirickettsia litoralis]